jgi:hypothetical protein
MSNIDETFALVHEEEELILQASRLHEHPDWERLMEIDVTPALVVAGERRLRRSPS